MDGIISYCMMKHPNEAILVVKGKFKDGRITVEGLVIPPFSYSDPVSAGFDTWALPVDAEYVGTVHSHPSGSAQPSVPDLHNFYGLVSLIIKWPYTDKDIFAWDSRGGGIPVSIDAT